MRLRFNRQRIFSEADKFRRSRGGRFLIPLGLNTELGRAMALRIARMAGPSARRLVIEGIQMVAGNRQTRARFVETARRYDERNPTDPKALDCYALSLMYSEDTAAAWRLLDSRRVKDCLEGYANKTNLIGARLTHAHEVGDYRASVVTARIGIKHTPDQLRNRIDYLKAAFCAGKMRDERFAIELFGRQYKLISDHPGAATDGEIEHVIETVGRAALHTIKEKYDYLELRLGRQPNVGIFFLSSTEALGHAILDPYHFIALNRGRFDKIFFIGPPRVNYRPASASCLQIVEQYGDYVETQSDHLMNLSWMSLGHHTHGTMTLVIDHYWALLRQAVHRTRDPADPFKHNAWHMALPPYYHEFGEQFCASNGIDLQRPLVVMHVRDKGYHELQKQSFRDGAVENYRQAVEWLLEKGYQVIRIGDAKMPPLEIDHEDYRELPFMEGYRHELDPFLIARARFMIGCQSGPCAFARALGTPLLTVNAVLHYTLLPSTMEMACFKRYFRGIGEAREQIDLLQALDSGVHHFDNTFQFDNSDISVENAVPDEILAAVKDMVAWLDNPQLAETPFQVAVRDKIEATAQRHARDGRSLPLPIGDYIGICLPGYRISPTVERMRDTAAAARPTDDVTRTLVSAKQSVLDAATIITRTESGADVRTC